MRIDQGADDEFRAIVLSDMAKQMDEVIDQIIHLEHLARSAVVLNGDEAATAMYARQAWDLYMQTAVKMLPTLIMGLADRVNQEREYVLAALEALYSIQTQLLAGDTVGAWATVQVALEAAPYERGGDE